MESNSLETHVLRTKLDQKLSICSSRKWRSWTEPEPVGVYFILFITDSLVTPWSITFMPLFTLPTKGYSLKCLWRRFLQQRVRACCVLFMFQTWLSYTGLPSSDLSACARCWVSNHGTMCLEHIFCSMQPLVHCLACWYDAQLEAGVWMKNG